MLIPINNVKIHITIITVLIFIRLVLLYAAEIYILELSVKIESDEKYVV